jgi:hypothetical protein
MRQRPLPIRRVTALKETRHLTQQIAICRALAWIKENPRQDRRSYMSEREKLIFRIKVIEGQLS